MVANSFSYGIGPNRLTNLKDHTAKDQKVNRNLKGTAGAAHRTESPKTFKQYIGDLITRHSINGLYSSGQPAQ